MKFDFFAHTLSLIHNVIIIATFFDRLFISRRVGYFVTLSLLLTRGIAPEF